MTSDDDPFAEPDDTERTVIRPNPGGRRPVAAGPATPPPVETAAEAPAGVATERVPTGPNPLVAAGSDLFALLGRLRNRSQHADPDGFRRAVAAEVQEFERRALMAGIRQEDVRVARYALCATIDDVVLNTPWAAESSWAQQSMVATFHRETVSGDRVYDLLAKLEQDPAGRIELLEFLYFCLSLGFEGRLRVEDRGRERHGDILAGLARIIATVRPPLPEPLADRWQGANRPHRPLSAWKPVWLTLGVLAGVLLAAFLTLNFLLSVATEGIAGQLAQMTPPGVARLDRPAPPAIPVPVDDTRQLEQVSGFLDAEIKAGLVNVFQDANTITIRLAGSNMFASASDKLQPAFAEPLNRVAAAVDSSTTGPVLIAGHSDSDPIRTARFPDNMALSLARAEAVRDRLAGKLADPARLRAEGRAAAEPIAPNTTREGKAQNRRIEIILLRDGVPTGGVQ